MKKLITALVLIMLQYIAYTQTTVPFLGKIKWINGYEKEIVGETLSYFSAFPDYATTSLLTRTTNGNKIIEWETAPVPVGYNEPYIYFSWVAAHSTGTSGGKRNFDLYVNNEKLLTFTTYPHNEMPIWSYAAQDSSRIVFVQTKMDGANDAHGLAYLRLPLNKIEQGKPIRLKVVGQNQNSNDWYMTFKFSFQEKVDISPMPFLLKNGTQPIVLTALHFGPPQAMQVTINNKKIYKFVAQEGINNFDIPVQAVSKEDSALIHVSIGKKILRNEYVSLKPVTPRSLYFIHHSHTDIGYSHLQPEVERIHNKNIDDALLMIEATKNFPAEARFKWNIESLWAVENYLKNSPADKVEKFVTAVKNGSICLSALYANILTGMSEPEEVFHYTDYARQLKDKYGIEIKSAMISDVPGYAWTTVTGLAKGGVKYFSSGPNYMGPNHPFLGDRVGHYVKTWGDKPVWWASPSGEEKILFWTAGRGYSSWHGTPTGGIFERGPKKIAAYLQDLDRINYPYEMVQWRYNIVADNGPIDTSISRFVAAWNEKYLSPKIILTTTDKLFDQFEKKYGDQIPVVKGDITPYWEDGAQSTALEEGENRLNSLQLQQLSTLYSMLNPATYNEQNFYDAWKNILLFHEHTWGAHNSITTPDIPFVTEQWRIKKDFYIEGEKKVNELQQALLNVYASSTSPSIAVLNTASSIRSGMVTVKNSLNARSIKDKIGNVYPVQIRSDSSISFYAKNLPPLSISIYELSNEQAPTANGFTSTDSSLSNGAVSIGWDKEYGSITNIKLKDNFNYAGIADKQGINSYWYVPGLNPNDARTNRKVDIKLIESGPVVTSVQFTANAPGVNTLKKTVTLFAEGREIYIENMIDKKAIRNKESVHFGFPFHQSLLKNTLDAGYGVLTYKHDQLPGSNMDYLYGRRWLNASSMDKGIQLLWLQAPLIEPEKIIDERLTINESHKDWKREGNPTSTWYSYIMNNYWHTNYKADQEGVSIYNYVLNPHGMDSYSDLERTAFNVTQPLIGLPIKKGSMEQGSLFSLSNPGIVVTSITPHKNNYLIRCYNPSPASLSTAFIWSKLKPTAIMYNGKKISANENITISGYGVSEVEIGTDF